MRYKLFLVLLFLPVVGFSDNIAERVIHKIREQMTSDVVDKLRGGICQEALRKAGGVGGAVGDWVKKFVTELDGITINANFDVTDLLPKLTEWVDVSAGAEAAVFIKNGKARIGVFGIPQFGAKIGKEMKSATGVRLALTSGCDGDPKSYSGYFRTSGAGGIAFSRGMDSEKVGACLHEGWRLLRGQETTSESPRDLRQVIGSLSQISGRINDELRLLAQTDFSKPPWNHSISHGANSDESVPAGQMLSGLRDFHRDPSEKVALLTQRLRKVIEFMDQASKVKDMPSVMPLVEAELASVYDELTKVRHDLSGMIHPFTMKDWNPGALEKMTNVATKQTRERPWNWGTLMHLECYSKARPRFLKITGNDYFDCVEQNTLSTDEWKRKKHEITSPSRLVANSQAQLSSLNDLWALAGSAFATFRAKMPVDQRSLRVGGNETGCENPMTNCQSISLPISYVGDVANALRTGVSGIGNLSRKMAPNSTWLALGGSLSYYYPLYETEIPLDRLGELGNFLAAPCVAQAAKAQAKAAPGLAMRQHQPTRSSKRPVHDGR